MEENPNKWMERIMQQFDEIEETISEIKVEIYERNIQSMDDEEFSQEFEKFFPGEYVWNKHRRGRWQMEDMLVDSFSESEYNKKHPINKGGDDGVKSKKT